MLKKNLAQELTQYSEERILARDYAELMRGIGNNVAHTITQEVSSENIWQVAQELRAEYSSRVAHCEDTLLQSICSILEPYIGWNELAKTLIYHCE